MQKKPLNPDLLFLSEELAIQLYNYLSHEYISHERYPLVHKLLDEIYEKYLRKI